MSDLSNYIIPLNGISPKDSAALKTLLEKNASLFDAATLSTYGGDTRYAVVKDSFSVTDITASEIKYICQVNYFAPCHDQNDFFKVEGSANYEIADGEIHLKLDETLWNVD